MWRSKIAALLSRIRKFKRLGMYAAVVLLTFVFAILFIGRERGTEPDYSAARPLGGIVAETSDDSTDRGTGTLSAPDKSPVNEGDKPVPALLPKKAAVNSAPDLSAPVATHASDEVPVPLSATVDTNSIIWPLRGDVLREVGIIYSRTFSDYRYHNGIDITAVRGAEVAAVFPGKVLSVETSRGEAKKIIIDRGAGWQAVYSHLEEAYVKTGETVKAGQAIGHVGQPGLNEIMEGPHLHFTLLEQGEVVNPLDYLPR